MDFFFTPTQFVFTFPQSMLPDDVWVRIIVLLGDQGGDCACLSKSFTTITQQARKMSLSRALQSTDGPIALMPTDIPKYPAIATDNDARFFMYLAARLADGKNRATTRSILLILPDAMFLNAFMWTRLMTWLNANCSHVPSLAICIIYVRPFQIGCSNIFPRLSQLEFVNMKLKSPRQVLGHLEHLPANTIYFEQCGVTLKRNLPSSCRARL
jgi:hypothetical protein